MRTDKLETYGPEEAQHSTAKCTKTSKKQYNAGVERSRPRTLFEGAATVVTCGKMDHRKQKITFNVRATVVDIESIKLYSLDEGRPHHAI